MTRLSRRTLIQTGIATAAALASAELALAGQPGGPATLLPAGKVEIQEFPWGSIQWLMSGKIDPHAEMTLGIVQVKPNQANPIHIHPNSAEYLHMLSGACEHLIDGRWVALKPGDTVRIPKNAPHGARTKDQPFRAVIVYDTPNRQMVPVK
jgi:quercetin dioxygenase-like cupin family protein